ncbi:hypothetical protein BDZ85DRAFT_86756 [Elsinoe ampelina]|uniref:Uncharacterized protein n=1 Tax=Elsinoe ampelina TaxID=302913 RepID=A0A6A6GGY8_9PEZI|nr:hypothetical protein BDZ85DRAFT_86756 [Elsinoe ampelina]
MIGANIYDRVPSKFCSSEWNVADWTVGRNLSTQALLDIWTEIPGLSASTYEAMACRDGEALADIFATAVRIQTHLEYWLERYRETCGPRRAVPSWSPLHWQGELGWQTVLVFNETEDAGDCLSYCTASNLVLRAALAVVQVLGTKLKLDNDWTAEHLRDRIHRNAIDVCRCIEYMIADERRGAGVFHLMMPTTGAWQVLRKDTPEGVWLREAMRDIHGDVIDGGRSMQGILSNLYESDTWL